jgi:hypothetical protein
VVAAAVEGVEKSTRSSTEIFQLSLRLKGGKRVSGRCTCGLEEWEACGRERECE